MIHISQETYSSNAIFDLLNLNRLAMFKIAAMDSFGIKLHV